MASCAFAKDLHQKTAWRTAGKDILDTVVAGMLRECPEQTRILEAIQENACAAAMAAQRDDYAGLVTAIRTSWELNQRLAPATNPAAIQAILDKIMDYLDASLH